MHLIHTAVASLGLISQVAAKPYPRKAGSRTYSPDPHYVVNETRTDAVKDVFRTAWQGYYKNAFPHDSLKPISNSFEDDRNGWGASAVDAFSTAIILQDWEVIGQILEFVPTIDFNHTKTQISLFETTIRYLGGLLSAYDLLTGPTKPQKASNISVDVVLEQAQRLADNLKFGFNTPSGVPDNLLYFDPPHTANSSTNGLATTGTLVLEWTRLSDLTGNEEYAKLSQKAEQYLLNPTPAFAEPFPGMVGSEISLATGEFVDADGGWTGGTDSFYEYLIKMYLYDPERFGAYKDRWIAAADSSIRHLASHPSSRPDLTFLAMYRNTTLRFISQHLACFDGGNFILGGLTLDEPAYIDFGLELVESCHDTYAQTVTGIGPEVFRWQDKALPSNATNNAPPPKNQTAFYERAGFWIVDGEYLLRPEVIEGWYYAYRVTGDTKYQDWTWEAFNDITKTCRAGSGFSSIEDVNAPGGGNFTDFQESFWFAETLKYIYLIHAEDADWQVKADHSNKFVYNTEAHPVRIASGREGKKQG